MNKKKPQKSSIIRQIAHFIIHLRWHYQVFILSGGFLAGGYLNTTMNWGGFIIQFLNVHLLLFGGATAYNSYWDKDEGPIGGLKNPPPIRQWMWIASLLLQFVGLCIAFQAGRLFAAIYVLSMIFFWLYSSPRYRWKGRPVLSLVAIGVSTGMNSLLLGYLAAGNSIIPGTILTASMAVALMILSIYPVSQLYQIDEDRRRGDKTFAIKFGISGVIYFFRSAFTGGVLLLGLSIMQKSLWVGVTFVILSLIAGIGVNHKLKRLKTNAGCYRLVMRIKYATSVAFVIFFLALLLFGK